MKNDQQFSLVSWIPAPLTSLRTPLMTFSRSSSANRSGISPEASKSLITTRNFSSGTWASVRRNTVPTPFRPALIYNWARSAYVREEMSQQNSCSIRLGEQTKMVFAPLSLQWSILFSTGSEILLDHWHRQPDVSNSAYHCHPLQQVGHCLEAIPEYD